MADMYQYRIEKLSGIPGVTCTHKMGFTSIFMFPIDCVLKEDPALNKRFDAAALKDKIGIFAGVSRIRIHPWYYFWYSCKI